MNDTAAASSLLGSARSPSANGSSIFAAAAAARTAGAQPFTLASSPAARAAPVAAAPAAAPPSDLIAEGRAKAAAHGVPAPAAPRPDIVERLRRKAAAYCHRRDVGQEPLATFGLVFSTAGALVLLAGHLGLGALLGGVGLLLGALAAVPHPLTLARAPLVESVGTLGDLAVLVGFFAGVVRAHRPVVAVLGFVVLVLMAWLPLVKARAGTALLPASAGIWRRGERSAILLLGALVGRPVPALAALAVVAGLDAWMRLERLDVPALPAGAAAAPRPRRPLLEDGSLPARWRWASLAVAALALFAFPVDAAWRF